MSDTPFRLLIDAGNTRVKFASIDANGLFELIGAVAWDGHSDEQPNALFQQQLHQTLSSKFALNTHSDLISKPASIHAVGVASDQRQQLLEQSLSALYQHTVSVQWHYSASSQTFTSKLNDSHRVKLQLVNQYETPNALGADRWFGALGALGNLNTGTHVCVLASFGTATTIDTLIKCDSADSSVQTWDFCGGLILPGFNLMLSSLHQGTGHLPFAHNAPTAVPTNTHSAISSGVAMAQLGALQLAIKQAQKIAPMTSTLRSQVLLTGGAAQLAASVMPLYLDQEWVDATNSNPAVETKLVDNLVLQGLASILP